MTDLHVIACNYAEGTNIARKGALAYVQLLNPGGGNDRLHLLVRSRGGRWVEKWEAMHRLTNFRLKTIPPEHPLYDRWLYPANEGHLENVLAANVRLVRVQASSDE